MTPRGGPARAIEWEGRYTCYGVATDPAGAQALVAAPNRGAFLAPLVSGETRTLVRVPGTESIGAVAVAPGGRWAATATLWSPDVQQRRLHVFDRRTAEVRHFPLPGATADSPDSGAIRSLSFAGRDRLISAGHGGVRLWDPSTGENAILHQAEWCLADVSGDGRLLIVACWPVSPGTPSPESKGLGQLLTVNLETDERRVIKTHGRDIASVAIDRSGARIATGSSTGAVRVGPADGSEPHLLLGSELHVWSVEFSPDGRWLASTAGNDVWLWPLPDLGRPPLHTLPVERLLSRLDSLTNLRVVEDERTPTGYRVEMGPFEGWEDTPTW
jgi:WD40 repeat protein